MDWTGEISAAIAAFIFLMVVIFFIIIWFQELKEFKDSPLLQIQMPVPVQSSQNGPDPELGGNAIDPETEAKNIPSSSDIRFSTLAKAEETPLDSAVIEVEIHSPPHDQTTTHLNIDTEEFNDSLLLQTGMTVVEGENGPDTEVGEIPIPLAPVPITQIETETKNPASEVSTPTTTMTEGTPLAEIEINPPPDAVIPSNPELQPEREPEHTDAGNNPANTDEERRENQDS